MFQAYHIYYFRLGMLNAVPIRAYIPLIFDADLSAGIGGKTWHQLNISFYFMYTFSLFCLRTCFMKLLHRGEKPLPSFECYLVVHAEALRPCIGTCDDSNTNNSNVLI